MNTALRYFFVFCLLGSCGSIRAEKSMPVQAGDRIAIVGNTFADQLRNHGYLEVLLRNSFKEDPVTIRNLGWAGDTLSIRDRPTNFPTEVSTMEDHETDLILACFGMGESFAGYDGLADFKKSLVGFIESHRGQSYNGESEVRLILISPIAYEDLGLITPNWKKRNQDLENYSRAMSEIAEAEGIPFVDVFAPMNELFQEPAGSQFTTNGIHLNEFGYWTVSHLIHKQLLEMISEKQEAWTIRIDAKTGESKSSGVELSAFGLEGQQFSFEVKENSSSSLPPPIRLGDESSLSEYRDTLIIESLDPGEYSLVIDGEPVVTASHTQWAEGVTIDASPAHREIEDYRTDVVDKNTQFVYSWKALNQVHIVGERRNSASGRALPQEVIEFNKLTKEKDAALRKVPERKTRQWQLVPDTKLTN